MFNFGSSVEMTGSFPYTRTYCPLSETSFILSLSKNEEGERSSPFAYFLPHVHHPRRQSRHKKGVKFYEQKELVFSDFGPIPVYVR